jgi:hypothetical protein
MEILSQDIDLPKMGRKYYMIGNVSRNYAYN